MWRQCEVRPPHPLYIQSARTTSSYSSFPTCSSTDGAAISMAGGDAMYRGDNWRFQKKRTWVMAHDV